MSRLHGEKKGKESRRVGVRERSGQAGIFTFVREDAISGMGLPVWWWWGAVGGVVSRLG